MCVSVYPLTVSHLPPIHFALASLSPKPQSQQSPKNICGVLRYLQNSVVSFGPEMQRDCGEKPAGFTRLTPGIHHPEINDTGKIIIEFLWHTYLVCLFIMSF